MSTAWRHHNLDGQEGEDITGELDENGGDDQIPMDAFR